MRGDSLQQRPQVSHSCAVRGDPEKMSVLPVCVSCSLNVAKPPRSTVTLIGEDTQTCHDWQAPGARQPNSSTTSS
jgi:hypothetical protein